ncbi:thiolase family protein [Phenylobacterium sp.]|jgi:acetyl-CoA C-acetyltransferase/acetyl-CoA acyltransferase|uniref:thiolase family protein n=1 Tax=Phenylobacterium sp. TaxID=1871053 RepID=UPI002F4267CC
MPNAAVIVDAVRTPMGRGKKSGALAEVHPVDLLATTLRALVDRSKLDPALIEDVIAGCVTQAGEQAATPGRMAVLAAGFPEHVPATTVDRKCGSGQQAILFAVQGVMAGMNEIVVACGVESMSRAPMGSAVMGADPFGPAVRRRYAPGLIGQGLAAELVAARWGLSRDELDRYSATSHRRAAAARESGRFGAETCDVQTPAGCVDRDETIRPETTAEALGQLRPSFVDEVFRERFPEVDWRVTAGNSSQITDGAAAMLIMSERMAGRLGLRPRARIVSSFVCGADPIEMLTAPIPASRRVLEKSGLTIDAMDHIEVNEAFACVPLAWQAEMKVDPERLNPCGGAIALGHPLGASGVRLMTTMLHALERSGGRYGLQAMCEAGGMANATIVERL